MKIIGKQESAGGFPCGFLFSVLFPPFPNRFWEGGKKGGWVSNYPCGIEQLCYNSEECFLDEVSPVLIQFLHVFTALRAREGRSSFCESRNQVNVYTVSSGLHWFASETRSVYTVPSCFHFFSTLSGRSLSVVASRTSSASEVVGGFPPPPNLIFELGEVGRGLSVVDPLIWTRIRDS